MSSEAMMRRRGFDGVIRQVPGLVEPAEKQSGSTQGMVGLGGPVRRSPCRLALEELDALPQSCGRLVPFADLRQDPGGRGYRAGKAERDGSRSQRCDPVLEC